ISSNLAGAQKGFGQHVKAERRSMVGVGFIDRDERAGFFARHAPELVTVEFKIVALGLQNVLLNFDAQRPNCRLQGCWRRVDAFKVTKIRVGPISADNLEAARIIWRSSDDKTEDADAAFLFECWMPLK